MVLFAFRFVDLVWVSCLIIWRVYGLGWLVSLVLVVMIAFVGVRLLVASVACDFGLLFVFCCCNAVRACGLLCWVVVLLCLVGFFRNFVFVGYTLVLVCCGCLVDCVCFGCCVGFCSLVWLIVTSLRGFRCCLLGFVCVLLFGCGFEFGFALRGCLFYVGLSAGG